MAQHTLTLPEEGTSPADWYASVRLQAGFQYDAAQDAAITRLNNLYQALLSFKAKRNRPLGKTEFLGKSLLPQPDLPRGLYFWGGVGRGKSMLMDVFFAALPYKRKKRMHFHAFMQDVHRQLGALKSESDPLFSVAKKIAAHARVLCFDEFHVSDIADAMILGRLLTHLFDRGVVLLLTSNYPPEKLYPNGLQRSNFLSTIALLESKLDIINLDGGYDHRQRAMTRAPLYLAPVSVENDAILQKMYAELSQDQDLDPVFHIAGHRIRARKRKPKVAWFDFDVLCGAQRSQVDYLAIAHECDTVLLSGIPVLKPEQAAEARRLTWLVDVFYDYRVKLIVTADAVPVNLYPKGEQSGEFVRTASRLQEMQTEEYLALAHEIGEGFSGIVET